jgi:drug/metabolite transporter (DMT)-like permease
MWIFFALLAPAISAVSNFIDKYLLTSKIKDYNAIPIYSASVGFIFGLLWWVITGFSILPLTDALLIISTGIITICSYVVYLRALSAEDTSSINLYFQLIPLFTLVLSMFFLKETVTNKQYIGFIITLVATGIFTLQSKNDKWHFPIGFWLIMLYDLMFAVIGIALKYVSQSSTFSQIISYEGFGLGIGGVIVFICFPAVRNAFLKSRKKIFKNAIHLIILNEIVYMVAKFLAYYAYIIGPVILASVLMNTQAFFAILFGWMLTIFYPHIFRENITKKTLLVKALCALLLFIGVYFMI